MAVPSSASPEEAHRDFVLVFSLLFYFDPRTEASSPIGNTRYTELVEFKFSEHSPWSFCPGNMAASYCITVTIGNIADLNLNLLLLSSQPQNKF